MANNLHGGARVSDQPTEGTMRAWWITAPPREPIYLDIPLAQLKGFDVKAQEAMAEVILTLIAEYDQYLVNEGLLLDWSNASGIEVFEDGEWIEWEPEE